MRQNSHHTPAWGGEWDEWISQLHEGMIRGADWEFSQDTGEPPTLCVKCHGIFYNHSESYKYLVYRLINAYEKLMKKMLSNKWVDAQISRRKLFSY